MAFKLQSVNVDLMSGMANVSAIDQSMPPSTPPKFKSVNIQFPFTPSGSEAHERDQVVAAAKAALQQALHEL
jgi:hypothetical protein